MKRLSRVLFVSLVWGMSAAAAATLALACSSFDGGPSSPDAAAAADADIVDAPAPETGSTDATTDSAAPSFCAPVQGGTSAHLFCADFEDGLTTAWRPNKDSVAWTADHADALTLIDGTAPNQPGTKYLQALTGTEPDAAVNAPSGNLFFTSALMGGFSIAFDMRADQLPTPGGVTAFDVYLTPMAGSPKTRIYMTLFATGGSVVIEASGQPDLVTKFTAGFPALEGAWRHLLLEVGGTGRIVRLREDNFVLVDTVLPTSSLLPASARLRIGAPYFVNGPVRMFWDNVTLDALP